MIHVMVKMLYWSSILVWFQANLAILENPYSSLPHIVWITKKVHRLETSGIIRSDRAKKDKKSCFLCRRYAKCGLHANHGGPDV